jgi:hypothetical protein
VSVKLDIIQKFLADEWHNLAGIPQIYYFGREGLHSILVIDLLGPSLENLFDMCGRKFSIKTVCMAARQMASQCYLTRIQKILISPADFPSSSHS